jgi:hypothetical protein
MMRYCSLEQTAAANKPPQFIALFAPQNSTPSILRHMCASCSNASMNSFPRIVVARLHRCTRQCCFRKRNYHRVRVRLVPYFYNREPKHFCPLLRLRRGSATVNSEGGAFDCDRVRWHIVRAFVLRVDNYSSRSLKVARHFCSKLWQDARYVFRLDGCKAHCLGTLWQLFMRTLSHSPINATLTLFPLLIACTEMFSMTPLLGIYDAFCTLRQFGTAYSYKSMQSSSAKMLQVSTRFHIIAAVNF